MPDIRIHNDGPRIVETNYWESELARRGTYYLSCNAGAFRLLLPPSHEVYVPEMATGKTVIVSRGPWTAMSSRDALEVMFDDGTENPFALHTMIEMMDRVPADSDSGRDWLFTVWLNRDGPLQVLERPARYRRVGEIPCLKPWRV